MWITSLLEKLLPALADGVVTSSVIDESLIKSVQFQLYKHIKLNPNAVARHADGGLTDELCKLKLGFERALTGSLDDEFQAAIYHCNGLLEELLSVDKPFAECGPLGRALQTCVDEQSKGKKVASQKKSFIKYVLLATTLVPMVAYGVHWTIANQLQSAIVQEVSVVYPSNSYEFIDGVYRLPEAIVDDVLEGFGEFYFSKGDRYRFNPLPSAFDLDKATSLGVKLKDNAEFIRAIESGQFSEGQFAESNLAVFRVFIRNIRDSNIVNHMTVSGQRVTDNKFPWSKINVQSDIQVSVEHDEYDPSYRGLWVNVEGAPITDLVLSSALVLDDDSLGPETLNELGLIRHSTSVWNEALEPIRWRRTGWDLVYVSDDELAKLNADESLRAELKDVEHMLYEQEGFEEYMKDKPYVYFGCAEGGATLLIDGEKIKSALNLKSAKAVQVLAQYKLLDGELKSFEDRIALDRHYLLREGVDNSFEATVACAGELAYYFQAGPAAGHAGGWVGAIDSLAVSLMDAKKIVPASIVTEKSALLNFDNQDGARERTFDEIHILKDGDYVLVNVFSVNMPGGTYEFTIEFDGEVVAETKVDILWPQSLRFEGPDVPYFRAGL